jgi:hypothetical protein
MDQQHEENTMAMAQYATIILSHISQQQGSEIGMPLARRTMGRFHLIDRAANMEHGQRTMCGKVAPHWGTDWNGDDNGQMCKSCLAKHKES